VARLRGPRVRRAKIELPSALRSLHPTEVAELEVRVTQLLTRWMPRSDSPDGLHRDLLALLAWMIEGRETPPHTEILEVYDD